MVVARIAQSELKHLTITGVDGSTSLEQLADIAARYPKIEFAMLVSCSSGSRPRFPSMERILRFRDWAHKQHIACAAHLCGRWARGALAEGHGAVPQTTVTQLCAGFGRVQINVQDGFIAGKAKRRDALERFADDVDCEHVIVQRRTADEPAVTPHPKVEYLFDRSAGRGRAGIEEWPAPRADERRTGYAGGIGRANIAEALAFVHRHRAHGLWLDMESNVRTNDQLDLKAVEHVCREAFAREPAQ